MTDAEIDALLTARGYVVHRKGNSVSVDGRPYSFTQLSNLAEMEANKKHAPFKLGQDAVRPVPSTPLDRLFPRKRKPLGHQASSAVPAPPPPQAAKPVPVAAQEAPLTLEKQPEIGHQGAIQVDLATNPPKGVQLCRCGRPLNHRKACRYRHSPHPIGPKPKPFCQSCGEPCSQYAKQCRKCVNKGYKPVPEPRPILRITPLIQLTFEQRIVALEEKVAALMEKKE